jgi:hypothetical protein
MKRKKPEFQVGQVVARKNAQGERDKYFRIAARAHVGHWYYKTDTEARNGGWGTLGERLRLLTKREQGRERE